MNIIISNDDGYQALGIRALAKKLSEKHNVTVVAPDGERSGYSHMVHFFDGVRCKKVDMDDGITTYAIKGSPADCVMFAVKHLFVNDKIDVVLSGINTVLNLGSDIMFSGTFGAAQEGTFNRLPSIAVSLRTKGSEDYAFAAEFVADNLELLMSFAKENITVNLNIPACKKEDVKGVRSAPIVYRPYEEHYVLVEKEGEQVYFIDGYPLRDLPTNPNGDCALSREGYITITPVQMLANDSEMLAAIKSAEDKFIL